MRSKFWIGIGTGLFVMLISSFIIPPACALIGALITGMIIPGKIIASAKAGVLFGFFGGVITLATYFLNMITVFSGLWSIILPIGMPSILISIFLFFVVSGFAGGAIGGIVKSYIPGSSVNRLDTE